MPTRPAILTLLAALAITPAALVLRADEAKDGGKNPKAVNPATQPSQPGEPPKPPRPDGPPKDDKRKEDGEKRPRGERGEWGQRGDMPPREWGPGGPGRPSSRFEQFTPEELKEMIAAVEPKNSKLADKMKEKLADAITRKPPTLTQEQIDAALDVFNDREPFLVGRIKDSLTKEPDKVKAMLAMQWPRIQSMIDLKKSDRQLYDAQTVEIQKLNDSRGITWKLREAVQQKNEAEVAALKTQLRDKLVEQHKARQEIRKLELDRLNAKVTKLSEEITAEEAKSAEQIDKHYQWLMKWIESPSRGPGRGERERRDGGDKGDKPEKKEKAE